MNETYLAYAKLVEDYAYEVLGFSSESAKEFGKQMADYEQWKLDQAFKRKLTDFEAFTKDASRQPIRMRRRLKS